MAEGGQRKDVEVFRRAHELAPLSVPTVELTPADFAEIAEEVGIPRDALALALAERAVGVASPSWSDRLVGPSTISDGRAVIATEDELRQRIESWLETGHGFRVRATTGGLIAADQRRDIVGKMMRRTKGTKLGRAEGIRSAIIQIDDETGALCCTVDLSANKRTAAMAGSAVGLGGAAVVVTLATVASPVLLAGVPIAAGFGLMTSRLAYAASTSGVRRDLDVTLDAIEAGQSPSTVLDAVSQSVRKGVERALRRYEKAAPKAPVD